MSSGGSLHLPCGEVNRSTPLNYTIPPNNLTLEFILHFIAPLFTSKNHEVRAKDVWLPIVWGLIVLLGVVGNLMVIIVILKGRQLRSTTNVFILNLSISDFLFIVCSVPFTLFIQLDQNWIFGDAWCKVMHYSQYVSCLLSVYTLVFMSMDRYLAIVHPLSSVRYRRVRHAGAVVGFLWPAILLSMTPVLLRAEVVGADACDLGYIVIPEAKNCLLFNSNVFVICFFAFAYAVPLFAIVVMYALMLKRVWTRVGLGVMNDSSRNKSKRKVTRMIVVIVTVFGLCWLPLQVYFLVQKYHDLGSEEWQVAILYTANALAYSNSCVNPFIYAFFSVQFRRSFMQVFSCCLGKHVIQHNVDFGEGTVAGGATRHTVLKRGPSIAETPM